MKLKPAGLLFDMDGVLVDSRDSWYRVFAELFGERFNRALSRKEFFTRYWARDLRDIFAELDLEIELHDFCTHSYSHYLEAVLIMDGAEETLSRFNRYPKAIITNTPPDCTRQILRKFRLERFFEKIITGAEVENGKPAPDIVRKGAEALGIDPEEAVLIGDSDLDVQAGKAAGCTVIGLGIEADYTIRCLPELLDLIET